MKNGRKYCLGLVLVCLLSASLRFVLAYALRDSFLERGNRSSGIFRIAETLVRDHEFAFAKGDPTASNEPVYPIFVAGTFLLLGNHWISLVFTQFIISLANAFLIYKISLTIFSDRAAASTAFVLFSFYPFYLTQSISVSDTVVFGLILALSVYSTLLVVRSGKALPALLSGLCWGLALLTRLSAISLLCAAYLYIFIRLRGKNRSKSILLISMACLLTLAPWVQRNHRLTNRVFVSSHGALEFWMAYNSQTRQILKSDTSVDILRKSLADVFPELKTIGSRAPTTTIQREVMESDVFFRRAFQFIREHPLDSIKMMPLKLWKFWSWKKTPVSNSLGPTRSSLSLWWDRAYSLYFPILFLLFIAGWVLSRKSRDSSLLLTYMLFAFSLFHMMIYGFTRLRVPIDQFLILYAAYALPYFSRWTGFAFFAASRNKRSPGQ